MQNVHAPHTMQGLYIFLVVLQTKQDYMI